MKALFILQNNMSIKNGGSICTKLYLDLFKDIFDDLYVMLPKQDNYAWNFSNYNLIEIPERNTIEKIKSIFTGSPHRFYPYILKYLKVIQEVDLIILSSSIIGYGIIDIIQQYKKTIICIHHNYEPDFHKDNRTLISLWGLNTNRIKHIEEATLNNSTYNITLTKSDELKFKQQYTLNDSTNIETIGCFLDKDVIKKSVCCKINEKKIVISGALCDKQTEDGIIHYINNLHPIVCSNIPNVVVCIAGRDPSNKLKNKIKNTKDIILHANPLNISEIINDATLYINPTFSGSGLKLRNIDPLKLGIPILAHQKSCAGYEELLDNCIWQYNSNSDFDKQLGYILNRKFQRIELQNFFYSTFAYEKAYHRMKDIIKMLYER